MLERGSYDMMDPALYGPTNSYIAEFFSHVGRRLHHITEMHIQLQARLDRIDASQREVHAKVNFLCGEKNNQFSCNETYSSFDGMFENQFNFPEVGITTELTT